MAWKQNIIEDFKQLVSFDSISFHERNTADWLLARLKSMGFSVEEDQAGAYYGGDTGNIFAVLDGELEGDPVIFCAHMDVVVENLIKKLNFCLQLVRNYMSKALMFLTIRK